MKKEEYTDREQAMFINGIGLALTRAGLSPDEALEVLLEIFTKIFGRKWEPKVRPLVLAQAINMAEMTEANNKKSTKKTKKGKK